MARLPLLLTLLLGSACGTHTSPPTAPSGPLDLSVTLVAGQTAVITSSLTIRFDHVQTDSRCPVDAVCVWAGEAVIVLSAHMPDEADQDLPLRISGGQGSPASHGGYTIELTRLDPAPLAGRSIPQNAYAATLRVTHP